MSVTRRYLRSCFTRFRQANGYGLFPALNFLAGLSGLEFPLLHLMKSPTNLERGLFAVLS